MRYLKGFFKVSENLAQLIAVGTSICGATAIVALAPSINAKKKRTYSKSGVYPKQIVFSWGREVGGGGPCPEILRHRRCCRRPAGKNPDGKITQDGNLLFQKCPSGLVV